MRYTLFAATLALAACGGEEPAPSPAEPTEPLVPLVGPDAAARAAFKNASGDPIGFAEIRGGPNGALIRYDLFDLPTGWHGAHLHEVGDCSDAGDGFKASGGHIDPEGKAHGFLNPEGPELADLPNLYARGDGRSAGETFAYGVSVEDHLFDEDGAAIIVHASPDDHTSQPIGGAGARIACGVVER